MIFEVIGSIVALVILILTSLYVFEHIAERDRAEEELSRERDLMHAFMDNIPDTIYFKDTSSRFIRNNRAHLKVLGLSDPKDAVGKTDFDFFTREYAQEAYDDEQEIVKTGKPLVGKVEKATGKADGQSRWISTTKVPIRDKNGRIVGIVGTSRDISERKQMEEELRRYSERLEELVEERTRKLLESETRLKNIFAASPDAMTVTDLKGNIVECNQATLDIHGFSSKDEIIGKNSFELVARKDLERAMENLGKTLEGGSVKDVEYTLLTRDGREFPAELSASCILDVSANPVAFVRITKDITERKQMEERLLRSERMAAIGELAATVGHDLRNPLTSIAGAAYYLKTKSRRKSDKKAVEMLEIIEKSIEYSNKIVDDLLDYSKEIFLDLTETTPRAIARSALSLIKIPRNINVKDTTQNGPRIKVDLEKMERVFINIVKNAIDAMPEGGELAIQSKEIDGNLQVSFIDTGTGISEEVMEKLWKPLVTTKARGMGFGLAISKRIVEAHGGSISLESAQGKGTTVTITLPMVAG